METYGRFPIRRVVPFDRRYAVYTDYVKQMPLLVAFAGFLTIGGCIATSKKEAPIPIFPTKLFATVSNPVQDMALLANGRIAVTDGDNVRVFDKDGKEVETYAFPEWVYRIVPNEAGTSFLCTLSDRTVWERNGAIYEQSASFGKYSLGAGELLIKDDSVLLYSGDGELRAMDMATKKTYKICDLDPFLGDVAYSKDRNRLYVGSTDYVHDSTAYVEDGKHSILCVDLGENKVLWEVDSDDVNALAINGDRLVVSERLFILEVNTETGETLKSVRSSRWPLPESMDSYVFDRFVVAGNYTIWDLQAKDGTKLVARISDGYVGKSARIAPDGRFYFIEGAMGHHEVQVADLSSLLSIE